MRAEDTLSDSWWRITTQILGESVQRSGHSFIYLVGIEYLLGSQQFSR